MENKIISIDTLQKLLTPREMQNVLGGSDSCLVAFCVKGGDEFTIDCPYGSCTCEYLWDLCEAEGGQPAGCGGTYC